MNNIHLTPFSIKTKEYKTLKNRIQKSLPSTKISVYKGSNCIFKYTRSYPAFAKETFCPFLGKNDKWYALYCPDCKTNRILDLEQGKDIGGEVNSSFECYPISYYIPIAFKHPKLGWITSCELGKKGTHNKGFSYMEKSYAPYAFVINKYETIEFIDLSSAHKGILQTDNRFGYLDVSPTLTLEESIVIDFSDNRSEMPEWKGNTLIGISNFSYYNLDGSLN